ncbi:hypothetical protein VTK73DRAFT_4999 [Phialemonium thermophilum]|uniref:PPM-type phosphatase domain-containing protein n=1 Tax=Phialemonium thermophilum TaxID=223376 RepID=A0ABR3WQK3_9PEZI
MFLLTLLSGLSAVSTFFLLSWRQSQAVPVALSTLTAATTWLPHKGHRKYAALGSVVIGPTLWWLWARRARKDKVPRLSILSTAYRPGEEPLSEDDVTRILSQHAYTFDVKSIAGVSRYDGAQIAGNSQCEDSFFHGAFPSPWWDQRSDEWMAWAVLDGHSGPQTAQALKKNLLPFVQRELDILKPRRHWPVPTYEIRQALRRAFLLLDHAIIDTALEAAKTSEPLYLKVNRLLPAFSGSCALLSLYDPSTGTLHVACTGDSRAVLGRQRPSGTWEPVALSVDQNARNAHELARITMEHPREADVIRNGRLLGLMVTRAFGDSKWKVPLSEQHYLYTHYNAPRNVPAETYKTPPYLGVTPGCLSIVIDPGRPAFVIMATDGLWDMISSQGAVEVVGEWANRQSRPAATNANALGRSGGAVTDAA